jgi:hypothetical protein
MKSATADFIRGGDPMHLYEQIYDFAASAGALEGYVYHREEMDLKALPVWIGNLHQAYQLLSAPALDEIQPFIDMTLGRAFRSLVPLLGESHEIVMKLRSMIKGPLPDSPDDFQKRKWFQK